MTKKTEKIRELNDRLRRDGIGGTTVITRGIQALEPDLRQRIYQRIHTYSSFTQESDPHEEHDFGSIDVLGIKVFWKIDYFSLSMEAGSEDPSDTEITKRILTIMLAEEY